MLYKNHLIVSTAISVPIMSQTGTLTLSNMLALWVGAVLPDIDEPESYIGRRTRGISDLIHLIFGHRGITHTLLFVCIFAITFVPLTYKIGHVEIGFWLVVGSFLHIFEDSFSNSGVKWLLPFTDKTYHIPIYSTGSLVEFLIGIVALIFLFSVFKSHLFDFQKDSVLNVQNVKNVFVHLKNTLSEVLLE